MTETSVRTLTLPLLLAVLLTGCDNSTDPETSMGTSPVITNFTFSPESTAYYPWGDPITVRGTVTFTDNEGDLATLLLSINPGRADTIDVTGATGITSGALYGVFRVGTGALESYSVTVTLIDSKGSRSNPTTKNFRVAVDRSGATWGYRTSGTTSELLGIAAGDSLLVAVGEQGTIIVPPPGGPSGLISQGPSSVTR